MEIDNDILETIVDSRTSEIPGLNLRGFRGEGDFPEMLRIIQGCAATDGLGASGEAGRYREYIHPPASL